MTTTPAQPKRPRGRGSDSTKTKADLMDAAFASLREDGYHGSSARAIATRANCNQASIYYHFDGIEPLLVAALCRSSDARLERYRSELDQVENLHDILGRLPALYQEDRSSGHLEVLAELIGGTTATPQLRVGINDAIGPWLEFIQIKIERALAPFPFGAAIPGADVADLILSLVLGVEMRTSLDGHAERADRLFQLVTLGASLIPRQPGTTTDA